jgi:hypothetical protein
MRKTLDLDSLGAGRIDGIADSFGAYMRDCAVNSLLSQGHFPGVTMHHIDDKEFFYIEWRNEYKAVHSSFSDEFRTTDFGAMGLAILLTIEITDYECFETSYTGSGIDFWLTQKGSFLDDFTVAVLEVTGIRKATKKNSIQRRLAIKLKQIEPTSGLGIPVFIAIVEFSSPEVLYQKR